MLYLNTHIRMFGVSLSKSNKENVKMELRNQWEFSKKYLTSWTQIM